MQTILKRHLDLRKVCVRWVPHLLTEEQKTQHLKCARDLLKTYKGCNSRVISNLLTGDESQPLVAQLDAPSDWRPGGRRFNPGRGRQHSFVEIDHEIFSTVILSLPLIQEGHLSVSGERMRTILVNCLED